MIREKKVSIIVSYETLKSIKNFTRLTKSLSVSKRLNPYGDQYREHD